MGRNYALNVVQIRMAAQMYAAGQSRREIAARFDVSEMAVRNALRLVKVPMRTRLEASVASNVKRTGTKYRTKSADTTMTPAPLAHLTRAEFYEQQKAA